MMMLKNSEGDVRILWQLLILVVPFLLGAYLLRYVPIRIQTGILIDQGVPESAALSRARDFFQEDPRGSSAVGIIQGLLWYGLVCFLSKSIDKQSCNLKSLGLALNGANLLLIPLGFIFGLMMYFGYFGVASVLNQEQFMWSPVKLGTLPIVLMVLNFFINGFGEETAFRAYWQGRLIDRYGIWFGILLSSSSFVLLHLLIYRFSINFMVISFLLACLYGILYLWTGSVFLVGTMHAVFNLTPQLLGQWPSDLGMILVNSIALVLTTLLFLRHRKGILD
jgi:membrane protease YdiL (CAAX protease family)